MAYFVSWRLQRVTVEYAYVSVPVLDDLVEEREGGTRGINVEKMVERALSAGASPEQVWYQESQTVQMHPMQQAAGNGEVVRRLQLPEDLEAAKSPGETETAS